MSSHISLTCPGCMRSGMKVRAEYIGRMVRCHHCQHSFRVPEDLPALRARRDELERTQLEALRERDELARRLEEVSIALARSTCKDESRDRQVESLEAEIESLRAASTADGLDQERQARERAEIERDTAREDLRQRLDEIGALASQLAAARAEAERTLHEAEQRHREQIESLTADRDRWKNNADIVRGERDSARAESQKHEQAARNLEARLADVYAMLEQANARTLSSPAPVSLHEAAMAEISVESVERERLPAWKDAEELTIDAATPRPSPPGVPLRPSVEWGDG